MKAEYKRTATLVYVVFQLTVFMILMKAKVTAEMVEGCVYSTMALTCNETKVISVSSVALGESSGCPDANCCPRHDHCTARPNDNHVNEVHRRCNGRPTCTVAVIRERIPCEWTFGYGNHNNDFERITYICIENGTYIREIRRTTEKERYTKSTAGTIESFTTDSKTQIATYIREIRRTTENERDTKSTGGTIESSTTDSKTQIVAATFAMPEKTMSTFTIAMSCAMACLVVLVIVLIFIILKRKKSQINANSNPAKLSDVLPGVNDATYEEIATSDDRTYEGIVHAGTGDIDKHTYAGLVTKIESPTYLELQ